MSTLLLRFAGPLQSWGTDSKFDIRRTGREPSKSGVIGMIASALGLSREDDAAVSELSCLRMGVRADQEGILLRDFQTVKAKKNEIYGPDKDMSYVTQRYYLADAVFLVGLEGDRVQLENIQNALRNPARPLYLGRRSCPPSGKLIVGIAELPLEEALQSCPMLTKKKAGAAVRMVTEVAGDSECGRFIRDQPVSFSQRVRRFTFRKVKEVSFSYPPLKRWD